MTFDDLVRKHSRITNLPLWRSREAITLLFEDLRENVLKGGKLIVPRFGSFSQRNRKPRKVFVPGITEHMTLRPAVSVRFRPSKYARVDLPAAAR